MSPKKVAPFRKVQLPMVDRAQCFKQLKAHKGHNTNFFFFITLLLSLLSAEDGYLWYLITFLSNT
jgi:hypothetical protein